MSEINLLGSDSSGSSVNSGVLSKVVARVVFFLLFLSVSTYIVLSVVNYTTNRSLETAQKQIQAVQAQALGNKDRNELVTRQEQLKELDTLVDNHVYWSYLLPELARITLKSASYTEITAKADGKMQLSVVLPSYADIEKFMQIFDLPQYNQQFSNVRIVGIDNTQSGSAIQTKLRLELTFNPSYIKDRL